MGFDPFAPDPDDAGERLQKFLAGAGVASRRHSETLIKQGRVTVNGEPARLGQKVLPDDKVRVNGVIVGPQAPRILMLNKPTGVVTTASDPQGRPTVVELVPDDVRVYPVGRLDVDTSGLLVLTNDGDLAHRMMHPSFGVDKTYRAVVQGTVKQSDAGRMAAGLELEDGMTSPAKVRVVQSSPHRSLLEIVIHEGRNRQVRRMCDAIGHPVIELARVEYGPLALGDLRPGSWRELTAPEIRRLQKVAGLAPERHRKRDTEDG